MGSIKKLDEYMKIKEAAKFLGVTTNTLRSWDKEDKIKTYRGPVSKYRLYLKEDLEAFLNTISETEK